MFGHIRYQKYSIKNSTQFGSGDRIFLKTELKKSVNFNLEFGQLRLEIRSNL